MTFNYIEYSLYQPSRTDVAWAKPVKGGFALYLYFNGKWQPQVLMNSKGTDTPEDDEPIVPGEGGELGPNTVGTDEIIDGSVRTVDLNKEVTDKLDDTYVQDEESLYINGTKPE